MSEATSEREQRQEVLHHPAPVTRREAIERAHRKAKEDEQRRGWPRAYPRTAMIDLNFEPDPALGEALRRFKKRYPFRLDNAEFVRAAQRLANDFAEVFEMPPPKVDGSGLTDARDFAQGRYEPHVVFLKGAPSVITLVHELIHAAGYGEHGAVYFSTNLFRLYFPKSFARLLPVRGSHVLRRPPSSACRNGWER